MMHTLQLHGTSAITRLFITSTSRLFETQAPDSLGPDEQQRLQLMKSADRRKEFITSRVLLRRGLCQTITDDISAKDWVIREHSDQPPEITNTEAAGWHISLTHSYGAVAVLITNTGHCGIDLELMRPRQRALMLAREYFNPDEAKALSILPERERLIEFYRLWSLKEALFKSASPSNQMSVLSARFSENTYEQDAPDAFWQTLGLFSLAIVTPDPPRAYTDEFFHGSPKKGALNLRPFFSLKNL